MTGQESSGLWSAVAQPPNLSPQITPNPNNLATGSVASCGMVCDLYYRLASGMSHDLRSYIGYIVNKTNPDEVLYRGGNKNL